jgi:hypothetical protein
MQDYRMGWPGLMIAETVRQRRKMLLHLKCLFWCLNQMQTRYDLNLVLYSLEHQQVHLEILDSNLGDNVEFLIENFEREDLSRLARSMRHLPDNLGEVEYADKKFIMGHYIQAIEDFGPITAGTYGIISSLLPNLQGLFLVDGDHLFQTPFQPNDVRIIFGTYIV